MQSERIKLVKQDKIMWGTLLKRYWQVTILKETPANTPYSLFLLSFIVVLYLVILFIQWSFFSVKNDYFANPILAGVSLLLSYFIYTGIILHVTKKGNRFVQTITSLLISSLIIHFFSFPFLLIASYFIQADIKQTGMLLFAIIYIVGTLTLSIWQFLAITHIYRCALELSVFVAILVSLGFLAASILTVSFWR